MKMRKSVISIVLVSMMLLNLGSTALAESAVDVSNLSQSHVGNEGEILVPVPVSTPVSTTLTEPVDTPVPTVAKVTTSEPTATPEPTALPEPTATPEPTALPEPTATPEPTASPEATATPEPTASPEPTATPEPTASPEPTATPEPTITPEPSDSEVYIPTALEIDTENIYRGMDRAYRDGYAPKIENEKVYIVLPLVPSNNIFCNRITVTPDLSGSGSTFIISNYQKTVELTEEKINGTDETKQLFYVEFELPLSSSRSNGTFPVFINIKGYDDSGTPVDSTFTIYINITDVVVPETPKYTGGGSATPTAEPVVLISNSVITPTVIMAGEKFSIKLSLKNSLDTKSIKNMLVHVDTGNLQINVEENSNVFQIEGIDKGGSTELEIHFSSDQSIPAGKYVITFSFTYDSDKTLKLSSTGAVIVEIKQPVNMELVMPKIADTVNAGDTLPLSFQIMNMGRDSVYNVRCEISGYGLLPVNTGYIGTMAAGTTAIANVDLYIGSLTMSNDYNGSDKYGDTVGTVKLIYEDNSGEEYSEEYKFDTTIESPIITNATLSSTNDPEEEKETKATQWWISVLILLVLIVLAVFLVIRRNQRRNYEYAHH